MSRPGTLVLVPRTGAPDRVAMATTTWPEALSRYITHLHAAGRSPGTIRLHRHYLRHAAGIIRWPFRATLPELERALARERWSPETRKSARSVLVGFYRWAHAAGHVPEDPSRGLPSVSVPPGQPRPAPEHVLERALAYADARVRLMLLLAARAGLRRAEIARVHSADLVDGLLYVHGKGGRVRLVPIIDPELHGAIARADGWLFPSRDGGHLSPQYVGKLMSDALPDAWTAHTLRHRFATKAYAGTRDVLAVGRVLGHARPETTQRYVQLPTDALHDVVAAAA